MLISQEVRYSLRYVSESASLVDWSDGNCVGKVIVGPNVFYWSGYAVIGLD